MTAWAPWTPKQAALELAAADVPWCVVGGHAVDLFIGEETRSHEDLEIAIPRADFPALRSHLSPHQFYVVHRGTVRKLPRNDQAASEAHQYRLLDAQANEWRMDVMLEPGDRETWIFRRDERVRAARARLLSSVEGVPFLNPEAVLLYKAKAHRPKDDRDFALLKSRLDSAARCWLRDTLQLVHPGHEWIDALT